MQFKSFLVPSKGRSNYYQGGNTVNIGGSSTFIPGGGGGSAIAETDYIYCMRREPGTEELTADQKSHNKIIYDKLVGLKGLPGSTPIFYIYGKGNLNPVKYDWITETAKATDPDTKAGYPPDWEKPEPPDPKPGDSEKGDIIRFTFIDTAEDGTAYMYVGKLKADGQIYISTKTTVDGGKDFQPDINAINEALGTKEDKGTVDTAFGRIAKVQGESDDNWNYIYNVEQRLDTGDYAQIITAINQDLLTLGEPTDDGTTQGQTDTAFGRIARLENGEGPALDTLRPVVQKNCFYIDAESNPDSKAANVSTFKNAIFYFTQDPKCSVPLIVRPHQDFEGYWVVVNAIPQPDPYQYKVFNSIIISFIKKDYETDEKFYIWTYDITKDGVVTFKDKRLLEGGSAPTPQPVKTTPKQYILKTKRETSSATLDTTIYTIIENIDTEITDNPDYRICFMQWKRHNKEGMKWTVPMFCGEWLTTSGEWATNHPNGKDATTKYQWADTWWPVHYEKQAGGAMDECGVRWFSNPQSSKNTLSSMVDLTISPTAKTFHNNNKRMRYGVAIFKNTGSGVKGWTRVSNIAEILCFAPSNTDPKPQIQVKN